MTMKLTVMIALTHWLSRGSTSAFFTNPASSLGLGICGTAVPSIKAAALLPIISKLSMIAGIQIRPLIGSLDRPYGKGKP